MNRDEFNNHVQQVFQGCQDILCTKGEDYSYADTDRLSNFKETAKEIDQSKYTIWYVYFNKGLSSIRRFITKGKVESENIHERIKDAINYLILLDAMIAEEEQLGPKQDPERPKCDTCGNTAVMGHKRGCKSLGWSDDGKAIFHINDLTKFEQEMMGLHEPEHIQSIRATSVDVPNQICIPQFIVNERVNKHGIRCKVTRVSIHDGKAYYDLESCESEGTWEEVPQSEVKKFGLTKPIG